MKLHEKINELETPICQFMQEAAKKVCERDNINYYTAGIEDIDMNYFQRLLNNSIAYALEVEREDKMLWAINNIPEAADIIIFRAEGK